MKRKMENKSGFGHGHPSNPKSSILCTYLPGVSAASPRRIFLGLRAFCSRVRTNRRHADQYLFTSSIRGFAAKDFFLLAFIFYVRPRVKNERTQKYYFPGRALLNSYADQKLFLGAMTY